MDRKWFDLQESGKGKIVCINQKWEYHDYIISVNDVKFKKHLKDLLSLDWKHYKLYLVGGVLENRPTIDIDIFVIGKRDKNLIPLLNKARSLGPFDLSYQASYKDILNRKNNVRAKSYDRLNKHGKPFPNGEWIDDLYWITCNFYKLKNKTKFKKPVLLN